MTDKSGIESAMLKAEKSARSSQLRRIMMSPISYPLLLSFNKNNDPPRRTSCDPSLRIDGILTCFLYSSSVFW